MAKHTDQIIGEMNDYSSVGDWMKKFIDEAYGKRSPIELPESPKKDDEEELLILPHGKNIDDKAKNAPKLTVRESTTILKPDGTKVVLAPEEEWIPGNSTRSCTCGIEAIGGGIHSDYCDKAEK